MEKDHHPQKEKNWENLLEKICLSWGLEDK